MLRKLISHSQDLRRLWDEGYEIEVKDNHLLIHHVPYLNASAEINYGSLVSTLHLAADATLKPDTHKAYFIGDAPCDKSGQVISAILHSSTTKQLSPSIVVQHMFSSKPAGGYSDYFEKMTTYINIISAPAKSVDESVMARTFKVVEPLTTDSPFHYIDTNSTRAQIDSVTAKLAGQVVALVGLGGTGSYVLDLVAKTPVKEIHLYDGDILKSHNAFRAPGAASVEVLRERINKAVYFAGIYSKMHRHIVPHDYYVDKSSIGELSRFDFVFLNVDNGSVRKEVVQFLQNNNIPFVDTGMGLQNIENELIGIVRVTTSTQHKNDHVAKHAPVVEELENEYATNIQIADLNALSATLAVIKWKKLSGFYNDLEREHNSTYSINVNMLTSSDYAA